MKEGQVFSWSSEAQKAGNTTCGRIWSFLDISDCDRAGQQLATVKDQLNAAEEELHRLRRERETQEAVIRKNEEIIDIIARAASDGIITSIGGNIVSANKQFAAMLGYSTAELAGRPLPDFISPDSPGEVMDAVRSGSGGDYEYSVLHRNGSPVRVETTGYPVRFQGDTILVSIVRRVPETTAALPQEESPESAVVQPEPEEVADSTSQELISETRSDREIRPEPVSFVSVPAGITPKEHDRISLTWEVDDAHLPADAGGKPSRDIENSSLITEIDDVIGPDTDADSHGRGIRSWLSELRRKRRRFF